MAKIDVNGDGKADFSINFTQIVAALTLFASILGSYYTLKGKLDQLEVRVERAERLPAQEVRTKDLEVLSTKFDLKLDKVSIQAKENMDNIKDLARELRNNYKRNR